MIVESIAEWQYLVMGATGCALLGIVLMAIYVADLHNQVRRINEDLEVKAADLWLYMEATERRIARNDHDLWRRQM